MGVGGASWRVWTGAAVAAAAAAGGGFALAPTLGGRPYEDPIVVVHSGDGSALQALIRHGACEIGHRHMEVKESTTDVRLRVLGARPKSSGECIGVLVSSRLTAALASPLGNRVVRDWHGDPLRTVAP
jgi:anti-sigma-K factor RskA